MTASRSTISSPTTTSTTKRTAKTTATASAQPVATITASRGRPTIPNPCQPIPPDANMLATLLLSRGTPMLLAGDEIARTQQGNNNAYCQDNEISWVDWEGAGPDGRAQAEFVRKLLMIRGHCPCCGAGASSPGAYDEEMGSRTWAG